jgi:O-antigen ligase
MHRPEIPATVQMTPPETVCIKHPTDISKSLLYWVTIAYVVGIPNFVHFDSSGRTADPVNVTSVALIVETAVTAYLLAVCLLLERRASSRFKWNGTLWLWICLFLQFTAASILQPRFRLSDPSIKDLLLSSFYIFQWLVAFLLTTTLYRQSHPSHRVHLIPSIIGRVSWIWVTIVWFVLLIFHSQAYGAGEDTPDGVKQLGGQLVHPAKLAVLAGAAFFYSLFYFRPGWRKWLACGWALLTVALTHARTAELAFVVALILYTLITTRDARLRWGTVLCLIFCVAIGSVFSTNLNKYLTRGQSVQTIGSLDDRTRIWKVSLEAIKARPWRGYGYVVGERMAIKDRWQFTHWLPPHSHNEFIGTTVGGGLIALAALAGIYFFVSWRLFSNYLLGIRLFVGLIYLQLLIGTAVGPLLGNRYNVTGGLFLLCCVCTLERQLPRHSQTRHGEAVAADVDTYSHVASMA